VIAILFALAVARFRVRHADERPDRTISRSKELRPMTNFFVLNLGLQDPRLLEQSLRGERARVAGKRLSTM